MGHASMQTTLIYADYALDPKQGALYADRAFGAAEVPRPGGDPLDEPA